MSERRHDPRRREPSCGCGPDPGAACGCCEGLSAATPEAIFNRPGLDALRYRVGTHGSFLETMLARLSGLELGEPPRRPLDALTTRSLDDPSIALLDAWAVASDVLTFYQERLANEAYLRTARERRSLVELARLVGYRPRPGVAASVYLAFDAAGSSEEVTIPAGTRAQSVPEGEGELPQFFETGTDLVARARWNAIEPRRTRPQDVAAVLASAAPVLYLAGTATNLRPNDPLCIRELGRVLRVLEVTPDAEVKRTAVAVEPWRPAADVPVEGDPDVEPTPAPTPSPATPRASLRQLPRTLERFLDLDAHEVRSGAMAERVTARLKALRHRLASEPPAEEVARRLGEVLESVAEERAVAEEQGWARLAEWTGRLEAALLAHRAVLDGSEAQSAGAAALAGVVAGLDRAPSEQPASSLRLARSVEEVFDPRSQMGLELLATFRPRIRESLYAAWENAAFTPPPVVESVEALRISAAPFGATAPLEPIPNVETGILDHHEEWDLDLPMTELEETIRNVLPLDAVYEQILPGTCVVIDRPDRVLMRRVTSARTVAKSAYGITGRVTELTLDRDWLSEDDTSLGVARQITVYARGEALPLAEAPIDPLAEPVAGGEIELGGLYPGLDPGRWLIVSGERSDVPNTRGVEASELAMIAGVRQGVDPSVPGDKSHTFLQLAEPLAYAFRRDSVKVRANVVEATHGETRGQVLGSGDAGRAHQGFELAFAPLTHVAAATPAGAESTLEVRVHGVRWHEAASPAELGADDRRYLTHDDSEGEGTAVVFGDGRRGARLPTGVENVSADYRQGLGKVGNVKAGQISLLATQPLGAEKVSNPLPATGGADRDGPEAIRRNAPLAVTALDRLVSDSDYADFARTFAGIAKASARRLTDSRRQLVHLTVAGLDDVPIAGSSSLLRNLRAALAAAGDPHQPFEVAVRERMLLVVAARVRPDPDHRWEDVEAAVRAALLEAFGFERRELGQDVALSRVISAIQGVRGVAAVDVDTLGHVDEDLEPEELGELAASLGLADRIRVPLARLAGPSFLSAGAGSERAPRRLLPARIAYLEPTLPDTLILREWT